MSWSVIEARIASVSGDGGVGAVTAAAPPGGGRRRRPPAGAGAAAAPATTRVSGVTTVTPLERITVGIAAPRSASERAHHRPVRRPRATASGRRPAQMASAGPTSNA